MVYVKETATTGIRDKLREFQRFCEEGGESVPATIFDVVELAHESIEMKRKNATMLTPQMDLGGELVETRAVGRTMCGQTTAAKDGIEVSKPKLADAQMALEMWADKSYRTESVLRNKTFVVEKSLDAEKAPVGSLKDEPAILVWRKQWL